MYRCEFEIYIHVYTICRFLSSILTMKRILKRIFFFGFLKLINNFNLADWLSFLRLASFPVIMSKERSEDSCIGLADFFSVKVLKASNNYRCAFIHIDAFMNALRYICRGGSRIFLRGGGADFK